MSLYAISDLHLSFSSEKPMEIFGDEWEGHYKKIRTSFEQTVSPDDTVIIAGDISWAMTLKEAASDLEFLDSLPGRKIILKGNHDYWWKSLKKNCDAFPHLNFLQNNFFEYDDFAICGTRGWPFVSSLHDRKIYERELIRLSLSLDEAKGAGFCRYICVTHFPPLDSQKEATGFSEIIERVGTEYAIFGHLHGKECAVWKDGHMEGGCRYMLTSCDFLDFKVAKII